MHDGLLHHGGCDVLSVPLQGDISILLSRDEHLVFYQFHPWKKIIHTPEKKNDSNEDERSEVIPFDQPAIAQSEDINNLEMEVIDETQTSRIVVHIMEAGVIDDQAPENMESNNENDGKTKELKPDSSGSNKSVLVYEVYEA